MNDHENMHYFANTREGTLFCCCCCCCFTLALHVQQLLCFLDFQCTINISTNATVMYRGFEIRCIHAWKPFPVTERTHCCSLKTNLEQDLVTSMNEPNSLAPYLPQTYLFLERRELLCQIAFPVTVQMPTSHPSAIKYSVAIVK